MKKISIITVVKNGMPFLKTAIQSIKYQNIYDDIEHIIVCSPSNDGTDIFLKSIKNIKLIFDDKSKNKFESINLGIKHCSTNIIGLLHADDVFYSSKTLEDVIKNFDSNLDILYGDILFSDKKKISIIKRQWISSPFNRSMLRYGWMPPHTSMFVKRKLILDNLYNTKYPISGDYLFILNLLSNENIKTKYVKKFITIMRSGGDSTNLKNFFKKIDEDINIIKIFFKPVFFTIFFKIFRKINQFQIIKKSIKGNYLQQLEKEIN